MSAVAQPVESSVGKARAEKTKTKVSALCNRGGHHGSMTGEDLSKRRAAGFLQELVGRYSACETRAQVLSQILSE